VLAEASTLLVRSLRTRQSFWISLALVGLATVLVAFVCGDRFLATRRTNVLDLMGIGWFAALTASTTGWYLGHRRHAAALK
jgi:putative Mn2+ efflux pump MntP